MDVWADFRVFELNKIDKTYERFAMPYGDVENKYNLIIFGNDLSSLPTRNNSSSAASVIPINFLERLYLEENNASSLSENMVKSLKNSRKKEVYEFNQPPNERYKAVLRGLLQDKIHACNYIESKYNNVKRNNKHITVLPVSLCLREKDVLGAFPEIKIIDGWVAGDISGVIKFLRKLVSMLLNKLKHRSIYSRFTGYTQLLLLNESGFPYVQINFFISGAVVESFYAEDINNVWSEITRRCGVAQFYIFKGEGISSKNVIYKDGRKYFPGDDYFWSKTIEGINELSQHSDGSKPKKYKQPTPDVLYKKFFFLVSCRYTRIPGQRALSSSEFTYFPTRKNKV
ncbi:MULTISPECIES: hypothetical protein [Enterobacteriaceae]|uniref:hypothetical protein n=1 Tax=Enterobacteriaceae TaxID=543 RepID=UPI000ED4EEFF|nr:hypothetical protein [Enterobacteriaceae bacterium]